MGLPILIFPGIMSSGLEVVESSRSIASKGQRVWLNPVALGFGSLYFGGAMALTLKSVEKSHLGHNENDGEDPEKLGSMTEDKHDEQMRCKSDWLHHISLSEDMVTEREGNTIRPIAGLDGVDFLTEVAAVKVGASYVFGHLIKTLEVAGGYRRGFDLDAAPYDWRLPPARLEERDNYFSESMKRIERMFEETGQPVVMLCHSMGCKVGHYLLCFAEMAKGRDWIDKYIHTYMPVGAPHVGASITVEMAYSASINPLLDPMMSEEERLIFGRYLGSSPWLCPRKLPDDTSALPSIFSRDEGAFEISFFEPFGDVDRLVRNKHGSKELQPFKVELRFGDGTTLFSDEAETLERGDDGQHFAVHDTFVLRAPSKLDGEENEPLSILLMLMEPGNSRGTLTEPLGMRTKIISKRSRISPRYIYRRLKSKIANELGVYNSNFAMSQKCFISMDELAAADGNEITMQVPVYSRLDTNQGLAGSARSILAMLRVKWIPPLGVAERLPSNIAELPCDNDLTGIDDCLPKIVNDVGSSYTPVNGCDVFRTERHKRFIDVTEDVYEADPVGPRTRASTDAPPVSRVFAIYGINVDTQVSAVCRRAPMIVRRKGRQVAHLVPDDTANFEEGTDIQSAPYLLKNGVVYETSNTPQRDLNTGLVVRKCGDGSVPYFSLQQCQRWDSPGCHVRIEEINGAEHREILAHTGFHALVLEYVGGKEYVDKFEENAVKAVQMMTRRRQQRRLDEKKKMEASWSV